MREGPAAATLSRPSSLCATNDLGGFVRHSVAIVLVGLIGAGCAGEGPDSVAERFWTAAQARDIETVEALSIESESTQLNFENTDNVIDSFELGESFEEDGETVVPTTLNSSSGENALEFDFETIMVRQDGDWKVDLDATSNRMIRAVLGASMGEIGEAIGEGMKDAMEGIAEGMAEGMREMGEAMGDAMEETPAPEAVAD